MSDAKFTNPQLGSRYVGDPEQVRAWQKRMGFTRDTAAEALGISRSAYGAMIAKHPNNDRNKPRIDLRTAYACVAIEEGRASLPGLNPNITSTPLGIVAKTRRSKAQPQAK